VPKKTALSEGTIKYGKEDYQLRYNGTIPHLLIRYNEVTDEIFSPAKLPGNVKRLPGFPAKKTEVTADTTYTAGSTAED
jgi:hypothetical protein